MVKIENDCVCCQIPCSHCGADKTPHYYCDECGCEDDLYEYCDGQLCADCLLDKFDKVEVD